MVIQLEIQVLEFEPCALFVVLVVIDLQWMFVLQSETKIRCEIGVVRVTRIFFVYIFDVL